MELTVINSHVGFNIIHSNAFSKSCLFHKQAVSYMYQKKTESWNNSRTLHLSCWTFLMLIQYTKKLVYIQVNRLSDSLLKRPILEELQSTNYFKSSNNLYKPSKSFIIESLGLFVMRTLYCLNNFGKPCLPTILQSPNKQMSSSPIFFQFKAQESRFKEYFVFSLFSTESQNFT